MNTEGDRHGPRERAGAGLALEHHAIETGTR
jgi:hypothetical protein